MANFCNKCGAPVSGIFCVKCGHDTRLAGNPAPPAAAPQDSPPTPVSTPTPAASVPVGAPAAKFCNKCGAPSIGAPFCNKCGANLREAAAPALQPAAIPAAAAPPPRRDTTSITNHACATSANQGQSPDQDSRWLCRGGDYRRCSRCRRRVLRRLSRKAEGARGRARCRPGLQLGKQFQLQRRDHGLHLENGFRIQQQRRRSSGTAIPTAASAAIPAAF